MNYGQIGNEKNYPTLSDLKPHLENVFYLYFRARRRAC